MRWTYAYMFMLFTYKKETLERDKIANQLFQTPLFLNTLIRRFLVIIHICLHNIVGHTHSYIHDRVLRNISFLLVR